MPAAVVAAAATIGVEAIGFAFAGEAAVWSWTTVLAKSSMVASSTISGEKLLKVYRTPQSEGL